MEGDKEGLSSKVPDWKLCFYLKWKSNKTQAAQIRNIMWSSNKRKSKVKKKSTLINDWGNIAYYEESEQSEELGNNFGLSQIQLRSLGSRNARKILLFFLSLGNSISGT